MTLDDLKPDSALVTLRWDKIATCPSRSRSSVPQVVEASLQKQFRGIVQYTWVSYDDAANYFLDAKTDLPQGLKYADLSIGAEERYDNLMTKSRILAAMNKRRSQDVRSPGPGESRRSAVVPVCAPAATR